MQQKIQPLRLTRGSTIDCKLATHYLLPTTHIYPLQPLASASGSSGLKASPLLPTSLYREYQSWLSSLIALLLS